jgi:D-sedoheptulose 7-phosphate isomerase
VTSYQELVLRHFREGVSVRQQCAAHCTRAIVTAAERIARTIRGGGKVLLFGNGGSAADAQHFAAELVGRYHRERHPLPAIALTTDSSALTAIGNDYGFREVFARQLRGLAQPGDVAIAISTSGNSANVVAAVEAARDLEVTVIGLTGGNGGDLARLADIAIVVPTTQTSHIQEAHGACVHVLCELVEDGLSGALQPPDRIEPGRTSSKMIDIPTLLRWRDSQLRAGRTVVWADGCFDAIGAAEVDRLEEARALGDRLAVGVIGSFGQSSQGCARTARVVAALACVDRVVMVNGEGLEELLGRLRPDMAARPATARADGCLRDTFLSDKNCARERPVDPPGRSGTPESKGR